MGNPGGIKGAVIIFANSKDASGGPSCYFVVE
jgi:hypothetical protein